MENEKKRSLKTRHEEDDIQSEGKNKLAEEEEEEETINYSHEQIDLIKLMDLKESSKEIKIVYNGQQTSVKKLFKGYNGRRRGRRVRKRMGGK